MQDAAGIIDKVDLVAKVRDAAAAASASAAQAPPGYAFDPSTGYWYSEDAGEGFARPYIGPLGLFWQGCPGPFDRESCPRGYPCILQGGALEPLHSNSGLPSRQRPGHQLC